MSQATSVQAAHLLKLWNDQKLSEEKARRLLDGGLIPALLKADFEQIKLNDFQSVLRNLTAGEIPVTSQSERKWYAFTTITYDPAKDPKSGEEYASAFIKEPDNHYAFLAKRLLLHPGFTAPTELITLDLVITTPKRLGKPDASLRQIYDLAQAQNLKICPAWVGPHLQKQIRGLGSPFRPSLHIAIHPLKLDGHPYIFSVNFGRDAWLNAEDGQDIIWGAGCSEDWIFTTGEQFLDLAFL